MSPCGRLFRGLVTLLTVLLALYFFVCSLTLLSRGFRLVFGSNLSTLFSSSSLLANPLVGVMIGILATVLVQSSSTSTSVIVSMVSAGLPVRDAIPIILGSNVGTSVTNTVVALCQASERESFGRAFAAATVHDMFNWLAVVVILPIEMLTQILELSSQMAVNYILPQDKKGNNTGDGGPDVLGPITRPLTDRIVVLDNDVLIGWSFNDPQYVNVSSMLVSCTFPSEMTPDCDCPSLLSYLSSLGLSDILLGMLLSLFSLLLLCTCLILLMRVLNSTLSSNMSGVVHVALNSSVPMCPCLTGYLLMMVGALVTMIVRSSSVFTSTLTPLCGSGLIEVETIYPLTLGSNLGTTTTSMLAALAAEGKYLRASLEIAMVHLFFNLFGILLFYPIPILRIPVKTAKILGHTTAKYRWFALLYLLSAFFLLPLIIFVLSLISVSLVIVVVLALLLPLLALLALRLLQSKERSRAWLPNAMRNMKFLPTAMRSLKPWDQCFQHIATRCSSFTNTQNDIDQDNNDHFRRDEDEMRTFMDENMEKR